jgi:hypothetical protein
MRFHRFKTRIGSFLLALALVGAGLLVAFHHHEAEAKGAEHCATCHLGQQAKIGNLESGSVAVSTPDFFHESLLSAISPKLIASHFLLGKFSQAPPRA